MKSEVLEKFSSQIQNLYSTFHSTSSNHPLLLQPARHDARRIFPMLLSLLPSLMLTSFAARRDDHSQRPLTAPSFFHTCLAGAELVLPPTAPVPCASFSAFVDCASYGTIDTEHDILAHSIDAYTSDRLSGCTYTNVS